MPTWRNDWTGFFLVYFKWCYYLCIAPFRFEWDEHLGKFRIGKNRLQSLVCASQYLLLGLWYLKDLRRIPVDHLYKNPVVYFTLAFNLNAVYYHIVILGTYFWRRQERFLALVNFDCKNYATFNVKHKLVAVFLSILFAILPLLYTICGYSVISSSRIWDPLLMFRCLVVEGRFAFFLKGTETKVATDSSCSKYVPPDLNEISTLDCLLATLAFLMETSRQIVGFYSDFFPLICCLTIWTSTGALREFLWIGKVREERRHQQQNHQQPFHHQSLYHPRLSLVDDFMSTSMTSETSCKNENNNEKERLENKGIALSHIAKHCPQAAAPEATSAPIAREKVVMEKREAILENGGIVGGTGNGVLLGNMLLERYEVCKSFSRTVNRALGQLLFAYVLSSIMYLSTCMDAVLVLQDWFGKLRVAFFFFIFILMFFIGSEIVNKVYGVRAWLSDPENNAFLPEKNLLVLIHEVTCKSIGVSGNGMFTITYSTFMTVMTTTVTFFIIILQFQKPRGDWEDLSATLRTLNISLQGLNTLINQFSSLQLQVGGNFTSI